MTPEQKLEQARAQLLDFQSRHPRSREDVQETAEKWLADARRVIGSAARPSVHFYRRSR
jgi:hypothetical protein